MGKFEVVIRVQTATVERYRPQALEIRPGRTRLKGPARPPARLRECRLGELVAAVRQEIIRLVQRGVKLVGIKDLKMAL